jgi:hypothetical protein|eukprot:4448829-Prymnesium_polylepis.3
MARMAAADKRGKFDSVFGPFSGVIDPRMLPPDSKARRKSLVDRAEREFDSLIRFVMDYAPKLHGPELANRAFLERTKAEFMEMAQYFSAVARYLARPELIALSHVNLQIDNAFFWRKNDTDDVENVEASLRRFKPLFCSTHQPRPGEAAGAIPIPHLP